jgi:hypothetical protein
VPIDSIGDGTVYDPLDSDLGQGRHPLKCALKHVQDTVQIVGAQVVREIGADPVKAPRPAILLLETDEQAVLFLS